MAEEIIIPINKGRTSRQMLNAPRCSVYIWCTDDVTYPKRLAQELNRADLLILGKRQAHNFRTRGYASIIYDHAYKGEKL